MDRTHVGLLAAVRRLAALPTATASGSADADILAHANDILRVEMAPFVLSLRESYLVQTKSQAVTAGRASYRVPPRAIAARLQDVGMKDAGGRWRSLELIQAEERESYSPTSERGRPEAFYLQGNQVVLSPTPSDASETLELPYFIRPSEVVSTAYGTISDINTGTGVVTFSATGSFAPTTASTVDLVSATSGFECLAVDQTPTGNGAGTLTFSTLPNDLAVGDYVCTADQAPVPQLPDEFHPLLYVKAARRMAESLGAQARVGYLTGRERELEERLRASVVPRVEGEGKIITPSGAGIFGDAYDWWGW